MLQYTPHVITSTPVGGLRRESAEVRVLENVIVTKTFKFVLLTPHRARWLSHHFSIECVASIPGYVGRIIGPSKRSSTRSRVIVVRNAAAILHSHNM